MIFSSTVTIEGCRVTSLANLRGIGINGASPVLDGYVLRSNKQFGLAYNESAKPKLVSPQTYESNKACEVYRHHKFL